jgi:Planctomycete cytochrome C/WD domain, G-beta repeat
MNARHSSFALMIVLCAKGAVIAQDAPSYSKDVVPFLKKYCVECHRAGKIKGGLRLDTYDNIMKGLPRGRSLVHPGNPDKSKLVTTTEGKAKPYMPPKKEKLHPTKKEAEVLRAWVKAGAKDDTAARGTEVHKQPERPAGLADSPRGLVAVQESPSYAKHVRPFFVKYCVECHNAKVDKRGLNLDTYKSLLEGSDLGPVLVAAKPNESKLVQLIEEKKDKRMPPKTAKRHPTAKEISQVRAWVAAGAKDDSGLVKVAIPDIKPRRSAHPLILCMTYWDIGELFVGTPEGVDFHDCVLKDVIRREPHTPLPAPCTALVLAFPTTMIAMGTPGAEASLKLTRNRESVLIRNAHRDIILDMAYNASKGVLATASYDTEVKLWDIAEGKPRHTLKEHSDAVYAVGFSPDGKLLASGGADRAVKVFEVASGKLLYTLGESTDWVYTIAWSPDGKHLAAAGVDKSIRVWEASADKHKLVHSVFAHEAPVLKLIYGADGKTLYSLGEDRIVKAWDAARMVERKVYDKQSETVLAMAVSPDQKQIALGRYDGVVVLIDEASGQVQREIRPEANKPKKSSATPPADHAPFTFSVRSEPSANFTANAKRKLDSGNEPKTKDPFPKVDGKEPNNSPGAGQVVTLPASISGTLDRAGDVDYFRFDVKKGQQIGVQFVAKNAGAKLEPYLKLLDASGTVVAESSNGLLGHTFAQAGTYALGVRDRELRGGSGMAYLLRIGEIPIVTNVFPLGVHKDSANEVRVEGVFLKEERVTMRVPKEAAVGSRIPVPVTSRLGTPLGLKSVVVGEFPEVLAPGGWTHYPTLANPMTIPVPGTANGEIDRPGVHDSWTFRAKKGERLIVEVNARRLGSALDSVIEIVDGKDRPVPRAVLRSQAKTYVTFRDHDSANANIRIEAWGELAVNDYIYVGNELLKIRSLPTHPDADCIFFSERGQRTGYLDTTPTHLSNGLPMYKVAIHPPGAKFPPNGFPVVTLYYRNDDGGPGYGRDSRIVFDPPVDGEYKVKIGDSRGQGGANHGYRLTVRPPRPSFNVTFAPTSPRVYRGGAIPITATAERIDGYDGEIALKLENLPSGFSAPATSILPGENSTAFALYAKADATKTAQAQDIKLIAYAIIDGKKVLKEVTVGLPNLIEPGEIVTTTVESEVTLKAGKTTKLTVNIERQKGFAGRVPIEVRGLPHGVKVLDIGLNGILITERETRRTMVLYAEPWVAATDHPIVVLAKREGKNTEHAAKSVLLKVR